MISTTFTNAPSDFSSSMTTSATQSSELQTKTNAPKACFHIFSMDVYRNELCLVIWAGVLFIVALQFLVICFLCCKICRLRGKGSVDIQERGEKINEAELVNAEDQNAREEEIQERALTDMYATVTKDKSNHDSSATTKQSIKFPKPSANKEIDQDVPDDDHATSSENQSDTSSNHSSPEASLNLIKEPAIANVASSSADYCEVSFAVPAEIQEEEEAGYDSLFPSMVKESVDELESAYDTLMEFTRNDVVDDDMALPPPPPPPEMFE